VTDSVEERIALPVGEVALTRPRDSEALLTEEGFEKEEFLPYWAELWSSGVALAHDVAGRSLRGATAANATLNEATVETAQVAWAAPDELVERAPWAYVIAADVLYEPRNVDLLLDLLPRLVDRRGRILIADPGRNPAEDFIARAAAGRWRLRTTSSARHPRVRLHRLRLR
jgi:predicted nicotinamide N-methyase